MSSCGVGGKIFKGDDQKEVAKSGKDGSEDSEKQEKSKEKNKDKDKKKNKDQKNKDKKNKDQDKEKETVKNEDSKDQKVAQETDDPNVRYNENGEKLVRKRNPYFMIIENQPEFIWVRADKSESGRISESVNNSVNNGLSGMFKSTAQKEKEDAEKAKAAAEEAKKQPVEVQQGAGTQDGSKSNSRDASQQVRLLPPELQLEDGQRIFVNKIVIKNLVRNQSEDIAFLCELMSDYLQRKLDQYANIRISGLGTHKFRTELGLDRLSVLDPEWGIIQNDDSANGYLLYTLDEADSSNSRYAKRKIYKLHFYVFDGFSAQKIYSKEKIFLIDLDKIVDADTNEFNLQSVENIINEIVPELAMTLSDVGWYVKVITETEGRIFIDRGKESGVQVGDTLEMYGPGSDIIDQTTRRYRGRSVGQHKGVIRVTRLLPGDIAEVEIVSGGEIVPGDVGRVVIQKKELS